MEFLQNELIIFAAKCTVSLFFLPFFWMFIMLIATTIKRPKIVEKIVIKEVPAKTSIAVKPKLREQPKSKTSTAIELAAPKPSKEPIKKPKRIGDLVSYELNIVNA